MSTPARIPTDDERKATAFKRAVLYVTHHHGRDAAAEAFGDAEDLNRAWYALDVQGFKAYLWRRCRAALETGRGAA